MKISKETEVRFEGAKLKSDLAKHHLSIDEDKMSRGANLRTKPKLRTAPLTIRIAKDALTEKLLAPSSPEKSKRKPPKYRRIKDLQKKRNE
ncbi:hypothetical protein WR25_26918 [Diploscapter pachys]|uniref:Uncharacterized protein n=1 Tax=Diploscapter pachys TaxID=2018661 RepID=A0A2A2JUW5_9BILA|nr:hypothetical protein WR25_26918 [Diploscapter pachys]